VPNFHIQEQVDQCLGEGLLVEPWQVKGGYVDLPQRPGLGLEIDPAILADNMPYREELGGEFYYDDDGAVADW